MEKTVNILLNGFKYLSSKKVKQNLIIENETSLLDLNQEIFLKQDVTEIFTSCLAKNKKNKEQDRCILISHIFQIERVKLENKLFAKAKLSLEIDRIVDTSFSLLLFRVKGRKNNKKIKKFLKEKREEFRKILLSQINTTFSEIENKFRNNHIVLVIDYYLHSAETNSNAILFEINSPSLLNWKEIIKKKEELFKVTLNIYNYSFSALYYKIKAPVIKTVLGALFKKYIEAYSNVF